MNKIKSFFISLCLVCSLATRANDTEISYTANSGGLVLLGAILTSIGDVNIENNYSKIGLLLIVLGSIINDVKISHGAELLGPEEERQAARYYRFAVNRAKAVSQTGGPPASPGIFSYLADRFESNWEDDHAHGLQVAHWILEIDSLVKHGGGAAAVGEADLVSILGPANANEQNLAMASGLAFIGQL